MVRPLTVVEKSIRKGLPVHTFEEGGLLIQSSLKTLINGEIRLQRSVCKIRSYV